MSQEHTDLSTCNVAIIGGGFTGTTLAAQLLRRSPDVSITVIERFGQPGRGVAYGTQYGLHYLNVPTGSMSAFPDEPGHFLRWARDNFDAGVEAGDFLPRRIYGQYVESLIRDARQKIDWRQDEALSVTRLERGAEVRLRNGPKVIADRVVLAVGNFRPSDPLLSGKEQRSKRYIPFAWSASTLEGVERECSVLLIGSGLTSVDMALALRARDFRGRIHILSRRGVIPEWHQRPRTWPVFWNENSPRTTRGLVRLVREQVELASKQGIDWRPVIDSLRSVTSQIWQLLPDAEKRRFTNDA